MKVFDWLKQRSSAPAPTPRNPSEEELNQIREALRADFQRKITSMSFEFGMDFAVHTFTAEACRFLKTLTEKQAARLAESEVRQ